jgi:hypothetical protein
MAEIDIQCQSSVFFCPANTRLNGARAKMSCFDDNLDTTKGLITWCRAGPASRADSFV